VDLHAGAGLGFVEVPYHKGREGLGWVISRW